METNYRRMALLVILTVVFIGVFITPGFSQSTTDTGADQGQVSGNKRLRKQKKRNRGPGKEMGSGGADIGKGAAKGAGDLGKGAAGGAGHLVTGHPVEATVSAGKGVGGAAKNVGVGAGKGVGKIGKGLGGEFKKIGGRKHARRDEGNTGE